MRTTPNLSDPVAVGLITLRSELNLPGPHPPEVEAAAGEAVRSFNPEGRADLEDRPFATLDPATSTDLDQAFHLYSDGHDLVLEYAIADVAAFVPRGGPVEAEAWRRGETFYLPDGRIPLYPEVLCGQAASLLPDGPRPAVCLTVRIDPDGNPTLTAAERVMIRSRAKLAYGRDDAKLPPELAEASRRVGLAELERGAARVEFPEPVVVMSDDGRFSLEMDVRVPSEDTNASMSLAANLAVAAVMVQHRTGLFRTMPSPDDGDLRILRRAAGVLGVPWPDGAQLRQAVEACDPHNPRHVAFLRLARRGGGGAGYATFDGASGRAGGGDAGADRSRLPHHFAIGAAYAHATAPLRRLADRYVLDLVVDLMAGRRLAPTDAGVLGEVASIMGRAEQTEGRLERAIVDLVEAAELAGRVGQVFPAQVLDADSGRGTLVQLLDPPVRARVDGLPGTLDPGAEVQVRLTEADTGSRRVAFEATRLEPGPRPGDGDRRA